MTKKFKSQNHINSKYLIFPLTIHSLVHNWETISKPLSLPHRAWIDFCDLLCHQSNGNLDKSYPRKVNACDIINYVTIVTSELLLSHLEVRFKQETPSLLFVPSPVFAISMHLYFHLLPDFTLLYIQYIHSFYISYYLLLFHFTKVC